MNKSLFNNFYFLIKLTTTLILFSAVLFLGYLLIKSYKGNNEENYAAIIDQKIASLTIPIENYSQMLISINKKISDNEKSLKNLKTTLDNIFIDSRFDELSKENKNLQEQITNLSNTINFSQNKVNDYDENKNFNDSVYNLINLIKLKYESGSNINQELLLLQDQINDDSKNAYLEKLFVLSDQQFIGIVSLQNQFEKLVKKYLNDYYIKRSESLFISYLINFFYIEPNYNSNLRNQTLKKFSIIKTKLYEKDFKSSLEYLSLIDESEIYFKDWIEEAKNFIDFNENIKFFYST